MLLAIPSYILEAGIDSREILYAWDEWGSKKSIYRNNRDAEMRDAVAGLSQRGRMALVNGVAEWIVFRFHSVLGSGLPFDVLEAAWAGEIDRKYVLPFDMPEERGWSGPVKGVIRRALTFVHDTIDLAWQNGETTHLVLRITNLARYVLPHTQQFEIWFSGVVQRIRDLSPWDNDDVIGELVPREALDYGRPFDRATTERMVQAFLENIHRSGNAYLASVKTMSDWGFRGEPYRVDIQRDRDMRRTH